MYSLGKSYEECGGVARTVFANNYESLWGKIVSAVQECDPRKLFDIEVSKYATYTSNDASHRIVHIFVDPQDYLPFKVAFASQTIQRLVHQKYKEDVNKYLRDFFNVLNPLSSQDASLGLMRGSYFEQFCFYLLVSHKKFSCKLGLIKISIIIFIELNRSTSERNEINHPQEH